MISKSNWSWKEKQNNIVLVSLDWKASTSAFLKNIKAVLNSSVSVLHHVWKHKVLLTFHVCIRETDIQIVGGILYSIHSFISFIAVLFTAALAYCMKSHEVNVLLCKAKLLLCKMITWERLNYLLRETTKHFLNLSLWMFWGLCWWNSLLLSLAISNINVWSSQVLKTLILELISFQQKKTKTYQSAMWHNIRTNPFKTHLHLYFHSTNDHYSAKRHNRSRFQNNLQLQEHFKSHLCWVGSWFSRGYFFASLTLIQFWSPAHAIHSPFVSSKWVLHVELVLILFRKIFDSI
jgi:hypothetical protein